jgi:hypothetical protein
MDTLGSIKTLIALIVIAVTTITSWMLGVRMRQRINEDAWHPSDK